MSGAMRKLVEGEEVVPDRPELRGTVAEALAAMRADPAFVLWTVRFGPGSGWRKVLREYDPGQDEEVLYHETTLSGAAGRMWGACRRPDWMLDLVALSTAFWPGNDVHRKVVSFLVAGVEARAGSALSKKSTRALRLAKAWAGTTAASVLSVPPQDVVAAAEDCHADVGAAMRRLEVAKREKWEGPRERAAYLDFGAAVGSYFAALAVFDPRGAATVGMVLALLATDGAGIVSDEVAGEVRAAFPLPPELAGGTPS